jgi:hypothetical protein
VVSRFFTPEEANAALATVRPLVEQLVARHRAFVEARRRHSELAGRVAGNGDRIDPRALVRAAKAQEEAAAAVAGSLAQLGELGVLAKDLDRGLVDFPARRGGEEVLLCWELGEPEVAFWHGLEDGYAGRRPLPLS